MRAGAAVACGLLPLIVCSAWWCWCHEYILYYGDAASHLNISRAIIDSRTPGYDQLGTVWLPMLHALCLPFVSNDWLWSTGLAGTIPVALCFIVAGTCFFFAAFESYRQLAPALVVAACFALNPNVLYLAAIPMTEVVFLAGLALVLLAILRFRNTQAKRWIAIGAGASLLLGLTRYDGWFLIPFIALWFATSARRAKLLVFLFLGGISLLAPAYWIAHNWWETRNGLDFFNGPYSAAAIQGGKTYPGDHDWLAAIHYYFTAGVLCAGWPLAALGALGAAFAIRFRTAAPVIFLSLTPLFYIWSMHSSRGTPIFVPTLWPFTYYNGRYGIALVPLCAFAAGAIVLAFPGRLRKLAFLIPVLAATPWLVHRSEQKWICWKESQVNSIDRRAWTAAAAQFFAAHYRPGQGILTSTGDVTGIYCRAGIHLSETLNIGNGPAWFLATMRPDLYHPDQWLVTQSGDSLARKLRVERMPFAPVISIVTSQFSPLLDISARTEP